MANPTSESSQHHFYVRSAGASADLPLLRLLTLPSTSQLEQIRGMAEFKLTTLYVDYQHLMNARDILAKAVTEQYYRCVPFHALRTRRIEQWS